MCRTLDGNINLHARNVETGISPNYRVGRIEGTCVTGRILSPRFAGSN